MSCLRFGRLYSRSTGAWLPRGMYVNWNELRYLACATVRRVVAEVAMHLRALYLIFPIYSYHGTNVMCDNWNELSHSVVLLLRNALYTYI